MDVGAGSQGGQKRLRYPGARVIGNCWMFETEMRSSTGSVGSINHWAISSASYILSWQVKK